MMNRKDLFINAHEFAKAHRDAFNTYRAAFAFALKSQYADAREAKSEPVKTTAEKLEDIGIEAWEKGDMKRYYINENMFEAVFGLSIDRYKSGNICGATLNGEAISNAKAGKLIGGKKFYFDAVENAWFEKPAYGAASAISSELAASLRV